LGGMDRGRNEGAGRKGRGTGDRALAQRLRPGGRAKNIPGKPVDPGASFVYSRRELLHAVISFATFKHECARIERNSLAGWGSAAPRADGNGEQRALSNSIGKGRTTPRIQGRVG